MTAILAKRIARPSNLLKDWYIGLSSVRTLSIKNVRDRWRRGSLSVLDIFRIKREGVLQMRTSELFVAKS